MRQISPKVTTPARRPISAPGFTAPLCGLGVMFQECGDLQRAADAFDRVLKINPHHEQARAAREQLVGRGINQTL